MPQIQTLRFHFVLVLSILVGCVAPQTSLALSLQSADGIAAPVSLAGDLAILHDPTGELAINDIAEDGRDFQSIPTMVTQGYRKGAIWVRFAIGSPTDHNSWLLQIERPLLESVLLYAPDGSGGLVNVPPVGVSGDAVGARAYATLFRIAVPPVESTYFLRLQSSTSITTALNIWQTEGYERYRHSDLWFMGLVLGAIGAMILANLLFAFLLRDTLYLHYAALLVVSSLMTIYHMGYAGEVLGSLSPAQIHRSWGVIVCLYSVTMVSFLGRLFEFGRHWKWAGRAIWVSVLLNAGAAALALAGRYGEVGLFVSQLQQLSYLFIAAFVLYLLIFRRLHRYLLSAVAFVAIVALSLVMQNQYTGSNLLGIDGSLARFMAIGTLIHLVLLSAAVADRARRAEIGLRKEQERIILDARSAEQDLARKVAERTAELVEVNNSLKDEVDRRETLEEKLRQSLRAVNDALAQQRDFVSLVSHEIRAPLAVIAAAADNLSRSDDADVEGSQQRVGRIQQSARRMSRLIDNVLADERLEAGQAPATQKVDINDTIRSLETGLADDAAKRVRFTYAGPIMVNSDSDLLEIAVLNLIQNALKYSPDSSQVTVTLSSNGKEAVVEVADQGSGIAPDNHERIFDKYHRAPGQQASGSGLGLYISRGIARQHGGDVTLAESGMGGSTFRLTLPIVE